MPGTDRERPPRGVELRWSSGLATPGIPGFSEPFAVELDAVGVRGLSRGEALFAHARFGDDVAWRRTVVTGFSRLNHEFGETQEPEPRDARWLVEQHGEELPLREPQQEHAHEPQQEQRVPGVSGSQYDGPGAQDGSQSRPADNASSRAPARQTAGDEATGKPPASAEIQPLPDGGRGPEKGDAGAPTLRNGREGEA